MDDSIYQLLDQVNRLYFFCNFGFFHSLGIHPKQAPLLKVLQHNPNITQKQLAEELHVSAPAVAVSIQRMEKSGLVKRTPDESDRRQFRISLSAKGEEIMHSLLIHFKEVSDKTLDGFTREDLTVLSGFLTQMRNNLLAITPDDGVPPFPPPEPSCSGESFPDSHHPFHDNFGDGMHELPEGGEPEPSCGRGSDRNSQTDPGGEPDKEQKKEPGKQPDDGSKSHGKGPFSGRHEE